MKLPRLPFGLDGYVAIGLSVIAALAVGWLAWGIHDLGKKAQWKQDEPVITKLNTDLAQCRVTVTQQSTAIEAGNAAVERLQADGAARQKAAAIAIRKAQEQAKAYKLKADRIAHAKPGADLCGSARNLIADALAEDR